MTATRHARRLRRTVPPSSLARLDDSPSPYVERVDLATGRTLGPAIRPEELLVHAHRDHNPAETAVHYLASRAAALTGHDWLARALERGLARLARGLPGRRGHAQAFRFRRSPSASGPEARARLCRLRRDARRALTARGRRPRLRVLLTGATGFLGKEILAQAAGDAHLAEVVCLVRPARVPVPGRPGATRLASARQRGQRLLRLLGIEGPAARKFRFVGGDIEKNMLGLSARERRRLARTLTHVIHCAASVSFDTSYQCSFRANVIGSRHVLLLSERLQRAARSPFVAHVAVETSYVHGRAGGRPLAEDRLEFPAGYYNNYYELTKAMASLETERALFERGLRVVEVLPAIVTGDSRTGNNRGDAKVVNAPINAFGRIQRALDAAPRGWRGSPRRALLRAATGAFPADPSAELNLVPVDRVAAGVLAALESPAAVGARIHIAADRRVRSADIVRVMREELGVRLRLADPTLTRRLILPAGGWLLARLGQERTARSLARLATIFGVYGEWGQPVHGVGNDVRLLALPSRRPDSRQAFRMACRHNRYVLRFGEVTDGEEVARRERVWAEALERIELEAGRPAAEVPPSEFQRALRRRLDLDRFEPSGPAPGSEGAAG
jgi:nucleoside-diphosphate-sugar epimerase